MINDALKKIEATNVIQASTTEDSTTKLYSKDMAELCQMTNANVEVKDDYIKIFNDTETRYFDKQGKELKDTEVYPNNTLFANKENEKWGFTDKNGNTVVEAKYDKVTEFNEYGFAGVRLDGKWGVVNSKGEEVIAPTYVLNEEIEPYFIGKYYRVQYGLGEFYYTDLNDTTEDTINE